jgi:uncharacterized protein YidB (DUF937 family)
MSRGMPSMVALLGLLAVAGYQNKDKVAEMLSGIGKGKDDATARNPGQGGLNGLLSGGASAGSILSSGLGELLERFKQSGEGETAESWVKSGPNRPVARDQLERAIGRDVLAKLSQETGLSHDELITRLTRDLPEAVDKYTPDGRLPDPDDALR